MSGHEDPDPFDGQLGADLHEAADRVVGSAVTRTAVAGAVQRRRRRVVRARSLAAAVVALVVIGGLAMATASSDTPVQQVSAGAPKKAAGGACLAGRSSSDPAGWFRLSAPQAAALREAGVITRSQAEHWSTRAVLLTHPDLQVISDPPIEPFDQQMWDLGYEDSAGLELLRSERLLTAEQQASIADGIAPVLDQAQVDRVFDRYPTLTAIVPGGQPFPGLDGKVTYAPEPGGCGGGDPGKTETSRSTTSTTGTG